MANQKKKYDFENHGATFVEYLRTAKHVELSVAVYYYIVDWYNKHPNKPFFQRYKTIKDNFCRCGFNCTTRGIEDAIRRLKTPEEAGGYGVIEVEYNSMTKAEWIASGKNPKKYIFRTIRIKWNKLYKFTACFGEESAFFKSLPAKSVLKKLIRKRPFSYTKNLQAIFDQMMKEANIERYTTARKMFYGFIASYSSKYYDPTNKLIHNFIPDHLIDLQKEHDKEALDEYQRALELAYSKAYEQHETPLSVKEFIRAL